MSPNFALLDMSQPEVASLVAAMVQARDAVDRRSWAHPQEPTGEAWWADVLADPRARKQERRTDLAVKQAFYRLADEKRETILVACSKCEWRAAFSRDELIASHGADCAMPNLLNHLAAPSCSRLGSNWDRCGVRRADRGRAVVQLLRRSDAYLPCAAHTSRRSAMPHWRFASARNNLR